MIDGEAVAANAERTAALAALEMPGRRYRTALTLSREARAELIEPVQRALAAGASKTEVARLSGIPRPDLYKSPWKP